MASRTDRAAEQQPSRKILWGLLIGFGLGICLPALVVFLLMLRKGQWNGRQVIPEDWVEESTRPHSDARLYGSDAYGYMWWVAEDGHRFKHMPSVNLKQGTYSARGYGGHYIFVIPDHNMVVVHRVNTYIRGNSVSAGAVGKLLRLIFEAKLD